MSEAHAFLPPSSSPRWVKCALSASLERAYPSPEGPEAAEGTAAHWVFAEVLAGRPPAVGALAPNGVPVGADMLEAAELVYEDVRACLFPYYGERWREAVVVERRVTMPRIHALNWGTPDIRAWARLPDGRLVLFVWDFKYGHRVVEAFENWQLIDYTEGALHEAGIDGLSDQHTVVDMRVIQPRAPHRDGPVRSWRVVASDLRGYFNRLQMAAEEAAGPSPTARPDPAACRDCSARHACEAIRRDAFSAADQGYRLGAEDLDAVSLGVELRMLKRAQALLDARVSGLEAQAEAFYRRGDAVPWFSMESTPGRPKWTRPVGEVLALGGLMGHDFAAPPSAITPTQAIKKAPELEALISTQYSARSPGAMRLVPDDGSKARRIFSRKT